MNPVRLIFFDVTGTLLRPAPSVSSQYARAVTKYLELSTERLSALDQCLAKSFPNIFEIHRKKYPCFGALHGMTSRSWWHDVFSMCVQDCLKQLKIPSPNTQKLDDAFDDVYVNFGWESAPHAQELLITLRKLRHVDGSYLKLAAISNSDNNTADALAKNGLLHFLDTVVTSEEAKCEKPDTRIFDIALNKISLSNIPRNEVLYVGDSYEHDYVAPKTAGFQALLMTSKEYPIPKEHKLCSLMQVLDFVVRSNS